MAVSTASPTSNLILRLRGIARAFERPLFAIVLAMIAGGIVIMITTPGSPLDRFNGALAAYQALLSGAFGNAQNFSFTLTTMTPLILASLSVAIAYRAGLFNIGAAGQLTMGAMTTGIIGLEGAHWPGWLLIPAMLIGGTLAGTVWGGIVGALKAWRGAHEVVTTIMLNWIAFFFTDFLINGPFGAAHATNQTDPMPPQGTLPHIAEFYNSTLGTFLPKIFQPAQYLVDVGIFFALAALVVYWFLMSRTTFGYEIRVLGQNPKAARYAGIPIKRNIFAVMAIAGAFSGLAGTLQLMGQFPYQLIANTFYLQPTGFDAIGVALLGRTTAIGVLLASLLFGGLRQGGTIMQLNANVPGDLVFIIQALVLFSIAAEFLPAIQRALPKGMMSRRSSLVPIASGAALTDLPASDSAPVENGAEPAEVQKADVLEGGAGQSLPASESSATSSNRIEED
jgi:general nucleoside transport system permease protein